MYRGLSYEAASRKALDVCAIAVESGQTIIAAQHLNELSAIMQIEWNRAVAASR
jgi:hypothetical protein